MRFSFLQRLLISAIVLFFTLEVISQNSGPVNSKIYKLNYKLDFGLAAGGVISNFIGLRSIMEKPTLDSAKILSLDRNDIWFIDRGATKQKATNNENANLISDWVMNVAIALPALLVIDDKISRDWRELLLL